VFKTLAASRAALAGSLDLDSRQVAETLQVVEIHRSHLTLPPSEVSPASRLKETA